MQLPNGGAFPRDGGFGRGGRVENSQSQEDPAEAFGAALVTDQDHVSASL